MTAQAREQIADQIPPDRVEAELRKLWEAAGPRAVRARTMTVVALCETPDHVPIAARAFEVSAPAHGARTILVDWREGSPAAITARASLHEGPRGPASEAIRLEAIGEARSWVPDTVARLITADLPVFVWWVGDLPDHDTLFDRMAFGAQATIAVVNANDMDLRDLPVLSRLAHRVESGSSRVFLADFCWHRLRTWQELFARFFDTEASVDDLARASTLRISFQQRMRDPEPASTQAALFVGWLAARLGWTLIDWPDRATTRLRHAHGEVSVTFEATKRTGLLDGSLIDIELTTRGHAGDGRFRVHRAVEDNLVICWEGERPGTPFPDQCVRVHLPDDAALLSRVLEHPIRDRLFEASLHAAAALVAPIAPARAERAR